MSIINEALKKAEKSIHAALPAAQKNTAKRYAFYGAVLVLAVVIETGLFNLISRSGAPRNIPVEPAAALPIPAQQPAPSPAPLPPTEGQHTMLSLQQVEKKAPELALNGIFFSEDKGYYALINNRIIKKGDIIEGAEVSRIDLDKVELVSEGRLITLKND